MTDNVDTDAAELRKALKKTTLGLIAAVSLLKSGSKEVAPSDKMFDQMIADYEARIEVGRAALGKGS